MNLYDTQKQVDVLFSEVATLKESVNKLVKDMNLFCSEVRAKIEENKWQTPSSQ
jgi:uncharacterized protein YoxC